MGYRLYSLREILPVSASPMSYAVAVGCNPVAMLQSFCGHRAGTEKRSGSTLIPEFSVEAFNVLIIGGFPGWVKTICTLGSKAHVSRAYHYIPARYQP